MVNSKKGQAQIITTILIILLVLATITIVWQVIQGTVDKGAEEIEEQSACLGLSVEITKIDTDAGEIIVRPNKEVDAYRAYVDGEEFGDVGGSLDALETATIIANSGESVSSGEEVEVLGMIGDTWCPGTKDTAE